MSAPITRYPSPFRYAENGDCRALCSEFILEFAQALPDKSSLYRLGV